MNILTLKKSYKQSIYIMNVINELEVKLSCKICNKVYASMSSLCNHNKKFHSKNNNDVLINNTDVLINNNNVLINNNECIYCNKCFKSRQNKWDHQKNHCKNKNNIIINNNHELERLN
jgi:hypothetical protein